MVYIHIYKTGRDCELPFEMGCSTHRYSTICVDLLGWNYETLSHDQTENSIKCFIW